MPLTAGTRLGPYEIVAPLGAGGMGEVYRARDTRLGREVAVKVLPERLAHDTEALERFEREARAVAALSHPNLIALHDFVRQDTTAYAVTELLDGETLRARLASGPLPARRVIDYSAQIAQGLAAAHEKGIVHRDLKPENLFVTGDGRVKILDFGLARHAPLTTGDDTSSPTVSHHTEPGALLGTVAYMAPEQVRGHVADTRSDIFSFGVVLYEMLSGRRPFRRDTAAETMTAILKEDPPDLPAEVPIGLAQIVDHCLAKDPAARVNSARDLAFDLQLAAGFSTGRGAVSADAGHSRLGKSAWLGIAIALAAGSLATLGGFAALGRLAPPQPVSKLSVLLPPGDSLSLVDTPALSRDGRVLAFVVRRRSVFELFLRDLGESVAERIPAGPAAYNPFFSPDGRWLGFGSEADSKLKVIPVAGGTERVLADATSVTGATWTDNGTVFFAPHWNTGLWRVSAQGGQSHSLTSLAQGEAGHKWPQALPGGKTVLFTVELQGKSFDDARIETVEVGSGRRHVVVEGGTYARYVRTGHVLFVRAQTLYALPYDANRLEVTGPSVPVLEGVSVDTPSGVALFATSDTGTLMYVPGREGRDGRRIEWMDRTGRTTSALEVKGAYVLVALSPDGTRIAVDKQAANDDVWTGDLASGALTRLTFEGENHFPVWTPDSRRLIFDSDRGGVSNLYWMPADGSGAPERLTQSTQQQGAFSVAPDGGAVVFVQQSPRGDWDLWLLPLKGDRQARALIESPFNEFRGRVSPDGRWIAYESDASKRFEIYVQPFPGPGATRQVSVNGGSMPLWSRDGRELYFVGETPASPVAMASRVVPGTTFSATPPQPLFEIPQIGSWDIAPDGRFMIVRLGEEETSSREIRVILNWFEELKRRLPH